MALRSSVLAASRSIVLTLIVYLGAATVTEDGESRELHVGDAEFCADGHTHSIRNHTGSVTRFLAVIVPNR